jgi:K+-sensing histidine kinase KdpD
VVVRDITERKKTEDLVQQSLRRVIALRDINNAVMSTLDLQQVLDFLLEKIEQFFPYPIASTVRLFNRDKRLAYLACRNINDEAQVELTITIRDSGPGIGPEVLPDIFRPFFSTKKGKGMGLGLSICERIMKTHRGRISVESRPGEGTTFYLHFPVPAVKE